MAASGAAPGSSHEVGSAFGDVGARRVAARVRSGPRRRRLSATNAPMSTTTPNVPIAIGTKPVGMPGSDAGPEARAPVVADEAASCVGPAGGASVAEPIGASDPVGTASTEDDGSGEPGATVPIGCEGFGDWPGRSVGVGAGV